MSAPSVIPPSESFKLNRFLAEPFTRLLLKTPLTPNQVTILSLAFGVLSGWFISFGSFIGFVSGALAFQMAAVLDNCDGNIARAKNMRSEFGGWLDVFCDVLVDIAFFVGLTAGVKAAGFHGPIWIAGSLCVAGSLMNFWVVVTEKLKGFGPAVFNQSNPKEAKRRNWLYKTADALREGDSSWFILLFALFSKMDWLLWSSAVYMQIIWLSSLIMNFKYIFLSPNENR